MPVTAYRLAGIADGVGSNVSRTLVADGLRASLDSGQILTLTGFTFDIPPDAVIVGVEVSLESLVTGGTWSLQSQLVHASSPIGDAKLTVGIANTASELRSIGTVVDLWGATLTEATVSAGTFGLSLDPVRTAGGTETRLEIDFVRLRVYYEDPDGWVTVACDIASGDRTYTDTGLTAGATYEYRIRAVYE